MNSYDIVIIGSGPGGYVAAIRASQLGAKVAVVEKDRLGGVCLNRGCIPTKAIISSIELFTSIKGAENFGIEVKDCRLDYSRVLARKNAIVERLRNGVAALLKARKIDLISGNGRLTGIKELEVESEGDKRAIKFSNVIIATGSRPLELPFFKFDGKKIVSSSDLLQQESIPESLLIVGAGVVGCEFASIYKAAGSEVTLVEMMGQILPAEDREVARRLAAAFKKEGVKVLTGTRIEKLEVSGEKVIAKLVPLRRDEIPTGRGPAEGEENLEAEMALVCVGRALNSGELGLETLGIKQAQGKILVDEYLQTNVPGIYAIGDVIGGPLLAHVASYEGILAAENIMGKAEKKDYSVVPNCIFTHPGVATVGLTEEAAREAGYDVKVGKFPFSALGKAQAMGQTEGFVKIIGDNSTEAILGCVIMGPGASSPIGEAALAIKLEATVAELAHTIHAHPTLSEGIMEAAEDFYGQAIHLPR